MISACAGSPARTSSPLPEPIIAVRTETRTVCPIEILTPIPEAVRRPAGAVLAGNEAGLLFVGARFAREDALEALIKDAALSCRPPGAPPPDLG